MKVLVAARVSVDKGSEVDRIEQDDEAARHWAESQPDAVIVDTVKDRGVSGGIDPFKRPGLGPWLTKLELVTQYDTIVASAIDRLGRNAADLWALRLWAEKHGKRIVILAGGLQWPPAPEDLAGPMIWDVLGRVADIELHMMKKRIADTRTDMKQRRVLLGKAPFGFEIIGARRSKTLRPVEKLRPVLAGMVDRALRGDTLASIARWLDTTGVLPVQAPKPTRRQTEPTRWDPKTVVQILRNPALKGRRLENGEVVLKHEGIMSAEEWDNLQAVLGARPSNRRAKVTSESPWLIGNIVCGLCGRPMYHYKSSGGRNTYEYYRCHGTGKTPSTCRNMVSKAEAEKFMNDTMGVSFAETHLVERVLIPGEDFAAEIADIEAQLKTLDFDSSDYQTKHDALLAQRAELKARKPEGAHYEERPTGQRLGDVWPSLPDDIKHIFLQESAIKLHAKPFVGPTVTKEEIIESFVERDYPPNLVEQFRQAIEPVKSPRHSLWVSGDPHLTRVAIKRIEELK